MIDQFWHIVDYRHVILYFVVDMQHADGVNSDKSHKFVIMLQQHTENATRMGAIHDGIYYDWCKKSRGAEKS